MTRGLSALLVLLCCWPALAHAQTPDPAVLCAREISGSEPFTFALRPTDVIGVPDALAGTLITPEGYLYTGYAEVVFLAGSPLRPIEQRLRRLASGYLPMVEYSVQHGEVRLDISVFSAVLPGDRQMNPINFIRVTAVNTGATAQQASFGVGYRYSDVSDPKRTGRYRYRRPAVPNPAIPYEKLPYDQRYYMEGAEFDPNWEYRFDGDAFLRDGKAIFLFPQSDSPRLLASAEQPYAGPSKDPALTPERLRGVVQYDFRLAPRASRSLVVKMPARPVAAGSADLEKVRKADYTAGLRRFNTEWNQRLHSGAEFIVSEKKVVDTFRASLAFLLLGRDYLDGQYRQTPGKLHYRAFYLRDAAMIAQSYDLAGLHEDARKTLSYFPTWQQPDGNFVSDMWDGWGQTLWIYGEHAEMNRDRQFAAQVYPSVKKAVDWLEKGLAADPYGTFPAGPVLDAEYLTGRFGHVTGWNFVGLGGLRGAIKLARMLGHNEDVQRYERIYDKWKANFEKRLNEIAPRIGGRIPSGLDDPTGLDGSVWFNLYALYPVEIFEPFDPRVTATLEWSRSRYLEGVVRWEGNDRVRKAQGPPRVHPYLIGINTESALIRGEQEQALKEFYAMLAHTNATHGAPEQVMPGTRDPGSQLQPHGWFAATVVSLLRHMLVRERGNDLHLLSAVSPEWLKDGDQIEARRVPTTFGPVGFRVARRGNTITMDINQRFHTAPRNVLVHIPWYLQSHVARATADARPLPLQSTLSVPAGVKRIELHLRSNPTLPVMNHRAAVQDLCRELERTGAYWREYVSTGKRPVGKEEPR